ncbi:DUF3857 domain-containing protein [Aureivirga sp. CE67]|uniref:DUF3857 domain-containing protein n=1 Tax=Aureivirga sp. CE67 TaxID=1788983 RepID=UPI0018C96113|nr:DUF3857 domain-containing protein [Aureivirga sp. CE67]
MKSIFILLIISSFTSYAQNFKFGKVSKEELLEKEHPLEKGADAAFLYKERELFYYYNSIEGLMIEDRYRFRIKIYSKDGYDWAKLPILLHQKDSDKREKLIGIKVVTYNLEGDEIVKTKMKSDGVFEEEIRDGVRKKTLTFPEVKEGSVIEVRYKITSPYFEYIRESSIQEMIPVNALNHEIRIPGLINFKLHHGGIHPFKVEQDLENADIGGSLYQTDVYKVREENIPSLKNEPWCGNLEDYRSKIAFEIRSFTPQGGKVKIFSNTWKSVSKTIFDNARFGGQLDKTNFYQEDLAQITNNSSSDLEKAVRIYQKVKSKVRWNENFGKYAENGVRKAYKDGVGNAADINLLLVSMMRSAGLEVHPVLISTRTHGKTIYPTINGFNYVIGYYRDKDGSQFLLDATDPLIGFGTLPQRTLNWTGQMIIDRANIMTVNLPIDNISTFQRTASIKFNEDGTMKGNVSTSMEDRYAYYYRRKNGALSKDEIMDQLEENNENIEVLNCRVSNVKKLLKPVKELYQFESDRGFQKIGEDYYLDPMLFWGETKSDFTAEKRLLPIDYVTAWNESNIIEYNIPEGYVLKSKPEPVNIILPNDIGFFTFKVEEKGSKIVVVSAVEINRGLFSSDYYLSLKDLFDKVIEKHAEKLVFTKQ